MKKTMLTLALVSFIAFTSCKKENQTEATTETVEVAEINPNYSVDTANSVINWTGAKPTGTHTGTISLKDGSFEVTDGKVTGGNFTIDMTTINVTDLEGDDKAALEGHLKEAGDDAEKVDHFFNVNQHPTSNFKIVSIEEANGAFFVKGVLTMKGISKAVDFPAEINVSDTEVSLTSDPFKINRTTWGVNYGSKSIFDDLKDKFINDDIELVVKVKASK